MKTKNLIGLAVLGLLSSPLAHAFSDGSMTGMVDGGCEACHAGTGTTNTSISGPASIALGSSGTYTVRVTSSAAGVTHYGLDFGIFQGSGTTLATGPINLGGGLQNNAGEITHTAPIPLANAATFTWFPDTAGTYSIRGIGNAVIVDMDPSNDVAGLSSPRPFTVVVSAPTTVTTTTTAATTTTSAATTSGATTTMGTVTTTSSATTTNATTTTMKSDKYTTPTNLPEVAMYCGFCHGLTVGKWRIADAPYAGAPTRHKPGGMSKDKWKRIINKMIKKEGCPVPAEEVSNLARYYSSLKR